MRAVVAGVRAITATGWASPTISSAVYFDPRSPATSSWHCGNAGLIPADKSFKNPQPGDLIVAIGGAYRARRNPRARSARPN